MLVRHHLERVDHSLALGVRFLLRQQSLDGAWRSDTYGVFKDGYSLTPLVLHSLRAGAHDGESVCAIHKGASFLTSAVRPNGAIDAGPLGLSYPVYTAALTVLFLGRLGGADFASARAAWLAYLRARQLTENLGWQPYDREYGGWGYAQGLPRKPAPGTMAPPYTESNLSATVFALEALHSAGVAADDPALECACHFVRRCQNYSDDAERRQPAFDDGGFFFIYDDPARNKAGLAGTDRTGRQRFSSYGSMTADGLRGLIACGLPLTDERVTAARQWLETNFSAATHPGKFAAGGAAVRASVYYYYCWSLARALTAAGVHEIETPVGPICWATALAEELMRRQQPEGFWFNEAVEVREDDPIVATALAAGALAVCRRSLVGK